MRSGQEAFIIQQRLQMTPLDDLYVPIVALGELMKGALGLVGDKKPKRQEVAGYELMQRTNRYVNKFAILPYDLDAHKVYLAFSPEVKRVGREDCQIAAIAICHNAVVVTRNLRHFEQIPGVVCEDWAKEP